MIKLFSFVLERNFNFKVVCFKRREEEKVFVVSVELLIILLGIYFGFSEIINFMGYM